ncbi:MAG: ribose-phosphate diphosphokinase [Lentisphaeria bacterium]|nr:ribose-phosphate diphosphokinase [Lentisphaeria bacterium]
MMHSQSNVRHFPIAILATPGGKDLAKIVDGKLKELYKENGEPAPKTFIRRSSNDRFQNGEGKGVIIDTIRGTDLYIICDVGNFGTTYKHHTGDMSMTPDEHYMDLKRLLGAAKNMAQRTTVVMPLLYASRQHKMHGRESLDCAMALQELVNLGVDTIMTIDAHNSHVMNAIPMHGLENLHATYQLILAFLTEMKGLFEISPEELVVCSPDLGGMERARYLANHFQVHLSGFYKLRDLTRLVKGKNPVIEHKFLGAEIEGKNCLVVDDMIASGGSMLEVCDELKSLGAKRIYMTVTYALYSNGYEEFDKAYAEGKFDRVFGTNASHIPKELAEKEWFVSVDVTRFVGMFIYTFNRDGSVTKLLDSTEKINKLLGHELGDRK